MASFAPYGTAVNKNVNTNADTRWSIVNINNIPLATGCPNIRIQNVIASDNRIRVQKNQKPFETYNEWCDYPNRPQQKPPVSPGYKIIDTKTNVKSKYSATPPSYIVSQKYYVLRENGITYIHNNASGTVGNKTLKLVKQTINAPATSTAGTVVYSSPNNPLVNLSQTEHNDIITNKPKLADLLQVYITQDNRNGLLMDFSKSVSIW